MRRDDIKHILVIGSGPIVIGQACEFDYSGVQAVRALKEEGYEVSLINPNPATVMTTPGLADHIFMEPLETKYIESIFMQVALQSRKIGVGYELEVFIDFVPFVGSRKIGSEKQYQLVDHCGITEHYRLEIVADNRIQESAVHDFPALLVSLPQDSITHRMEGGDRT